MVAQFVDVSQWNPQQIDWQAYKQWSAQGDGISRVAMRSSYGYGYKDANFDEYRAGALAAGIDSIIYYHYSYPSLNAAITEANWQRSVVGDIRAQDFVILDFEENVDAATAQWAYTWLVTQEANYRGKLPGIYASSAYIAQRLQDPRLKRYKLWIANWQFTPDERPPCPAPWTSYEFVQFTDRAVIPGIPGNVDCSIFLGKEPPIMSTTIPQGWADDGTTLKAPDGTPVRLGFRDHILGSNWDPANVPLEPEQHFPILEQSNPALGAGQRQICRKTSLEYTQKMGVFEGWLGQELLWYQKTYAKQQTQIALLQSQVADLQSQLAANTLAQENAALLAKIGQAVKDLS
jgi:GH25 family lysozyme M1 (1,4-beta-N-acetylmuramidase)